MKRLMGDAKNSRRIDVPKDHIPPEERRKDGLAYFGTDAPGSKDLSPRGKLLSEVITKQEQRARVGQPRRLANADEHDTEPSA